MSALNHNPEPLTKDNAALVLVDHQVGLMTGIRDYSIAELKHNVVGLANCQSSKNHLDYPLLQQPRRLSHFGGQHFQS